MRHLQFAWLALAPPFRRTAASRAACFSAGVTPGCRSKARTIISLASKSPTAAAWASMSSNLRLWTEGSWRSIISASVGFNSCSSASASARAVAEGGVFIPILSSSCSPLQKESSFP
jgi:hypothetical protein